LGHNHQVLAYGYELDSSQLMIKVYDPNTNPASGDGVHIALSVANPSGPSPIIHNIGIGDPIRGFFRVPYTPTDPSELGN